ncbi:MAG: YicC family protein [Flavobacteriales bacterium]|nr:YicC family protein [Flavobacteriales bacterium]
MIYSMTGYGKQTLEINQKKITIEIRTLNSKNFDVNLKYPSAFRMLETDIRNIIASNLDRGKIDFWINQEDIVLDNNYSLNLPLIQSYFEQLTHISKKLNLPDTDWLQLIMHLPDAVQTSGEEDPTDEMLQAIRQMTQQALDQCVAFRRNEGKALQAALTNHLNKIESLLSQIQPFEEERIDRIREKIRKTINELIKETEVDKNRYEQEIIYYIEKLDISEEKTRLKSHCEYFNETLLADGHNGRKLNFISQEMGREINTIGSKASDADIQRIVVLMKDELEKIKEQVLNIL